MLLDRAMLTVSPKAYADFLARLDDRRVPTRACARRLRRRRSGTCCGAFSAPEPLGSRHQLADFNLGVAALDDWLRRRAIANQASGASRVFVVCEAQCVARDHAVSLGAVAIAAAPGRFRRNMPEPIPVARRWAGSPFTAPGRAVASAAPCPRWRDARVLHAAGTLGIRGILVHAISEQARTFYLALGFEPSPLDPMTLMVGSGDVRKSLEG